MKHVKKSVLLWYSPAEMFALVTDVARYPEFLPWCERGEVLETHDGGNTARIHLAYAGVRHAFTTRNDHTADRQLLMRLVDGPFSLLDGTWDFLPLGNGQPPACKVEFDLQYAFASRPLEVVLSPVFDKVANTFVDAFVKRAEQVYGER
ncbi:type II toxin-antitoxin system RatA family toxin [Ideonella sp. 4Y16]|uniref:Type II toxin-antitoxin system RatA family toxin n=1 Tax=Ideonella alba TaxID=2824118 RepID=A0A941BBJ6_9BURK|nr:type II toxin-antitoxin system RatA family toxin [Ideonella alba]MBQ0930945.1 type II toxin-antitoxin system RatA family toxin [Ideonella alba]MBQ0942391.1 type II toxin-antitoxin system RatA family toxin [Ideonella alba]